MHEEYEAFTAEQVNILKKYVTNTSSHIFVIRNLPEVIKGALFSRYSRSTLGLRTLLLKEFISNTEETGFNSIVQQSAASGEQESQDQMEAIKKAQSFYDRILDGYGDDSIGELGGAHLAIENVSMLAAKRLEDARIGGSPLEKSTRYIYFDQKVNGEYLYYREPNLMISAYRDLYTETCNMLFETYSKLIPPLTEIMELRFPPSEEISKGAYKAALRAKVLDCLRGLLPAGTLTNMGIYGNGRFFEALIHRLHCQKLTELQEIGKRAHEELAKVIPSFVRRSDIHHHTHKKYAEFSGEMHEKLKIITDTHASSIKKSKERGVFLVDYDAGAVSKVAAMLLFTHSNQSIGDLRRCAKMLTDEELASILDAACDARENRRHKSPRALEHAEYTFEIVADFGAYRDLHRHRMLTQERQLLNCEYGYDIPIEIQGTEMEVIYCEAMKKAKSAFDAIASELPEEAQYVVPMAYNVRWYFKLNLRALQWLCELRSTPAGHPNYRYIAQAMAKAVIEVHPQFERFFKFVDYEGYELGRLGQEQRKADKRAKAGV